MQDIEPVTEQGQIPPQLSPPDQRPSYSVPRVLVEPKQHLLAFSSADVKALLCAGFYLQICKQKTVLAKVREAVLSEPFGQKLAYTVLPEQPAGVDLQSITAQILHSLDWLDQQEQGPANKQQADRFLNNLFQNQRRQAGLCCLIQYFGGSADPLDSAKTACDKLQLPSVSITFCQQGSAFHYEISARSTPVQALISATRDSVVPAVINVVSEFKADQDSDERQQAKNSLASYEKEQRAIIESFIDQAPAQSQIELEPVQTQQKARALNYCVIF